MPLRLMVSFLLCAVFPNTEVQSAVFPVTAPDDLGAVVRVASPPQRIVSLSPSTTEIVYALGLSGRLAGVTDYCDYPPEVKSKEKVGGYTNFSVEQVVALKPDLILAAHGNPLDVLDSLRRLGIPVFSINPHSLPDAIDAIDRIGTITGADSTAKDVVAALKSRIKKVTDRVAAIPDSARPRVMWGGWEPPVFTAGPGSFIADLISRAGGKNIASDASSPWPQYGLETVVLKNPEILIIPDLPHGGDLTERIELVRKALLLKVGWNATRAVRDGRVYHIDMQLLGRPGPRLVDGLEQLAGCIHPEHSE